MYLKGVLIDGNIKNIKNPDPTIISEKAWKFILNLDCTSEQFNGLPESIVKELPLWKQWIMDKDVQNKPLIGDWEEKLSRF